MRFLSLALLLNPDHRLRTSPYLRIGAPSDLLRRRQRLVDDIDELIRTSVHSFAFESSLLRSLLPSSSPTTTETDASANDSSVELIDNEFNRLSYRSDRSPDIVAYNSLLRAWRESRRADSAEQCDEVFARLKYAELSPNQETYDTLIQVWSLEKGERAARRAFEYFEGGRSHDLTAYTCEILLDSLIQHLEKNEAFDRASEVVEYMRRLSIPIPDSVFEKYLELVLACSENSTEVISSLAKEFRGMETRLHLLDQYLLRSLCVAPVADASRLSFASSLLTQLTVYGSWSAIQPAVYRDYIRVMCSSGSKDDVSGALSVLEQACIDRSLMESIGADPWNHILDTLARNTSKREDISQVMSVFLTMRTLNAPVDESTYQTMTSFMYRMEEHSGVLQIWNSRLSAAKAMFETYRCVILSSIKLNASDTQVEGLFLNATRDPLALRRTLPLLNEMITLGYRLRLEFCREILHVLYESQQWGAADIAIGVFKLVEKSSAIRADLQCFECLFGTFRQSVSLSHADNAWNALTYMQSLGVRPTLFIYESLLWTWVHSKRYK